MGFSIIITEHEHDDNYSLVQDIEGFVILDLDNVTPKERADAIARAHDGNLDIAYHDKHVEIYSSY